MKKQDLENKIKETIRILSCTHPDEKEQIKEYQGNLKKYIEEWRTKYEIDYKYSKRLK